MLGFSRYVILILTSFLIIAYTIGIANVWKGNYHSIFASMLLGSIEITSDNDKLYIGKIKLLTTFSYLYNIVVLIILFFIFPSAYPIFDTIIAFSILINQKLLTKHLKHQYGVTENLDLQRSNKVIQWSLLIGVVFVLGILAFTGNLSTPFMIYLGM